MKLDVFFCNIFITTIYFLYPKDNDLYLFCDIQYVKNYITGFIRFCLNPLEEKANFLINKR